MQRQPATPWGLNRVRSNSRPRSKRSRIVLSTRPSRGGALPRGALKVAQYQRFSVALGNAAQSLMHYLAHFLPAQAIGLRDVSHRRTRFVLPPRGGQRSRLEGGARATRGASYPAMRPFRIEPALCARTRKVA
jgi:hypothetical protein